MRDRLTRMVQTRAPACGARWRATVTACATGAGLALAHHAMPGLLPPSVAVLALAAVVGVASRIQGIRAGVALALGAQVTRLALDIDGPSTLAQGLEHVASFVLLVAMAGIAGMRSTSPDGATARVAPPLATMPASTPVIRTLEQETLVAQAAHELRTPLNAMTGWLHVMEAGSTFGEEAVARAERGLRQAVEQQRDIINAMDETAQALSGELSLSKRSIDWGALVRAALDAARQSLGPARDPGFVCIDAGVRLRVDADEQRLLTSLTDLLVLAARLRQPGAGLRITLGSDGPRAWARVSPAGEDSNRQFLDALHARVQSVASQEGGRARSAPMVLLRARAVLARHDGHVGYADDAPEGLLITVPLDALPPASGTSPTQGTHESMPADRPGTMAVHANASLSGRRVLVVDDQPEMRDVLATLLAQQGAEVCQAESAAQAFSLIAEGHERPFDVAILDVAMPGEDGLSLLRRIRGRERATHGVRLGAIALSAHASPALERDALAAGFDRFISKPLDPPALFRTLQTLSD